MQCGAVGGGCMRCVCPTAAQAQTAVRYDMSCCMCPCPKVEVAASYDASQMGPFLTPKTTFWRPRRHVVLTGPFSQKIFIGKGGGPSATNASGNTHFFEFSSKLWAVDAEQHGMGCIAPPCGLF